MTVQELNRDQLVELKQRMVSERNAKQNKGTSWAELAFADKQITDEEAFAEYKGTSFTDDDFSC